MVYSDRFRQTGHRRRSRPREQQALGLEGSFYEGNKERLRVGRGHGHVTANFEVN